MHSRPRHLLALVAVSLMATAAAPAMECDCATAGFCTNKADLASELDRRIRAHIAAGRKAEEIYKLEGGDSILRPRIERWANEHPQATPPDRTRVKYRGTSLPDSSMFSCFDSFVKLAGVCVGADKLGHFFQQGWECYVIAERDHRGDAVAKAYAE